MKLPPSELEVFDAAIARALSGVHTCLPAKVRSYDAAKQTCEVEPTIVREDSEIPVLSDVPVCFPGGGGFILTFPIAAGDFVLVCFSEADFSAWFSTGDTAKEDFRIRHGLHAIAIPCLRPETSPRLNASGTDLVIGKDGAGGLRATFSAADIKLGAATNFVALANLVASELTRINSDFTALKTAIAGGLTAVGVGAAANGPNGATAFNSASGSIPSPPGPVAATKVKAE